jgi:hypothetical protein
MNQLNKGAAPFSVSEIQQATVECYYSLGKIMHFMGIPTGRISSALGLAKAPSDFNIGDAESNATNYTEISYALFAETEFSKAVFALYKLAYFGEIQTGDDFDNESIYMWVYHILNDLANGSFASELTNYGSNGPLAASVLWKVAQTAQARVRLEEISSEYFAPDLCSVDSLENGLSFKEMALLSGMTEESLRAAANPKRPNPLPVEKSGNSTLIPFEQARKWLEGKGLRVPITRITSDGSEHLPDQFMNIPDLAMFLELHCKKQNIKLSKPIKFWLDNTHEPDAMKKLSLELKIQDTAQFVKAVLRMASKHLLTLANNYQ